MPYKGLNRLRTFLLYLHLSVTELLIFHVILSILALVYCMSILCGHAKIELRSGCSE
jgi:hypothetical protein